jgi:hypothetical protein
LPGLVGVGHHRFDLLDAGEHGGELDELGVGEVGDDLGQGGLAHAGRSPEDERAGVVALELHAQRLAGSEDVLLADELLEGARPHARRQGLRASSAFVLRKWLEQAHDL